MQNAMDSKHYFPHWKWLFLLGREGGCSSYLWLQANIANASCSSPPNWVSGYCHWSNCWSNYLDDLMSSKKQHISKIPKKTYFCKSLLIHSWFVNSCGIWAAASVTETWWICCRLYQRWEVFVVSKKSFKEAEFSTKWRSSHLAAGCNVTFLDFFRWWSVATSSHRIYWQSSSTWSQSSNVRFWDILDDLAPLKIQ